ncbi:helix-turn-helix domain-containing protein [Jidongwangia harbinensis]|uniref:helix-turn-helix domain-containing protein n=1 Tax=Jidongwangia harbinensis TaxID=2878561 RepID=UPI001CDA2F36|nr:AraC family transcriptional regulator [Jidongwangia harbinensis]MCA2216721.1 AraC family transcriptional regulator [Jidongwangia harbinensis]
MLERQGLLEIPGLRAAAVRCRGGPGWSAEERVETAAVVLVRRGIFLRRVGGAVSAADPTIGYVQRPGDWQQVTHPAGGDVCTTLTVPPEVADRVAHAGPVLVTPAADLAHRRLLAAARPDRPPPGSRRHGLVDVLDLAAEVLAGLLPAPRPVPRLADEVRAALHTDPDLGLDDLARLVHRSPWHVSRVFHRATGTTLSTYRRRLRVRAVLDALADPGRPDLATLAAQHGFADQAHLTRALRREIQMPPGAARRLLDRH